jgi:hypothetical protein
LLLLFSVNISPSFRPAASLRQEDFSPGGAS